RPRTGTPGASSKRASFDPTTATRRSAGWPASARATIPARGSVPTRTTGMGESERSERRSREVRTALAYPRSARLSIADHALAVEPPDQPQGVDLPQRRRLHELFDVANAVHAVEKESLGRRERHGPYGASIHDQHRLEVVLEQLRTQQGEKAILGRLAEGADVRHGQILAGGLENLEGTLGIAFGEGLPGEFECGGLAAALQVGGGGREPFSRAPARGLRGRDDRHGAPLRLPLLREFDERERDRQRVLGFRPTALVQVKGEGTLVPREDAERRLSEFVAQHLLHHLLGEHAGHHEDLAERHAGLEVGTVRLEEVGFGDVAGVDEEPAEVLPRIVGGGRGQAALLDPQSFLVGAPSREERAGDLLLGEEAKEFRTAQEGEAALQRQHGRIF